MISEIEGANEGIAESSSVKKLKQLYAQLQKTVRAIKTAIEAFGPSEGLRAELIVLEDLVDGIGMTLTSLTDPPPSPSAIVASNGATESAMLAQALRAIKDLRELRALTREERTARELAERQQLRAVEDFRREYRRASALTKKLDQAYLETITALANAVEARDNLTRDHVERVRSMSVRLGEILKLDPEALDQLAYGAVLHDIGKIGLPDAMLGKPGALSADEILKMREHPLIGRRMLEGVSFLHPALPVVEAHHERWDGTGYPHGLSGDNIPIAGRIVAVVDAYDAMTSDRPYRLALSVETARAVLLAGRGTQFDPTVVDAFLENLGQPPPITPDS